MLYFIWVIPLVIKCIYFFVELSLLLPHHKKSDYNLAMFALWYLFMLSCNSEETLFVNCHDLWICPMTKIFASCLIHYNYCGKSTLGQIKTKQPRIIYMCMYSLPFSYPMVYSSMQRRLCPLFLQNDKYTTVGILLTSWSTLSCCICSPYVTTQSKKHGQNYCRSIQSLPISIHWQRRGRSCGKPLAATMTWGPYQACNITATVQMYAIIGQQCLIKVGRMDN